MMYGYGRMYLAERRATKRWHVAKAVAVLAAFEACLYAFLVGVLSIGRAVL